MGAKHSRDKSESTTSLNPNERRRLTAFLDSTGSHSQFNRQYMQNLWKDLLVPDLLTSYTDFLMKQDVGKKNYIGVDEFALIYSALVRGHSEDKVMTLAEIIGSRKTDEGIIVSFKSLLKYLTDVLESYFLGLDHHNDIPYKSWTHQRQPDRRIAEQIMKGVCVDLPRKNDDVQIHEMERWLNYTGLISVLHSYVLGSLYNLEPELKSFVIPRAVLPTTKTATMLDPSQVIYLNSYLPTENKYRWKFLFSTLTHGESFSKLVGCIVNQGPILFILQSDDRCVFGGFISENINTGPKWVGSEDCFLFKLQPTVEVYPSTGYNSHFVYLNTHQSSLPNGLGMGGQFSYWGLWIDFHFGDGECSESCTTYKNYKMLASKKKFRIHRLEAWAVGDPPPTAEEMGERTTDEHSRKGRSILEKDATASQIMEMGGMKTYSRGIRKGSSTD